MTGFAEQLETIIKEGIEEYLGERDFKDEVEAAVEDYNFTDIIREVVRDEMPDLDDKLNDAVDAYDFSDAIHEQVKDYDWWEEIEDKVKDKLETEFDRAQSELQGEIDRRFDSPEFKELVKAVILEIIKDRLAELHQRIKDCLKWPWNAIKSLLARLRGLIRPN